MRCINCNKDLIDVGLIKKSVICQMSDSGYGWMQGAKECPDCEVINLIEISGNANCINTLTKKEYFG